MQKKNIANVLAENTFWVYGGKIITQLFGFIVTIFVIKKLSVDVYGTFNFLVASYALFKIIGIASFTSVFDRFIPEFVKNNDYVKLKKLIVLVIIISSIVLTCLIILMGVFQESYGKLFKIDNFSMYIVPFVFFVVLSYLQTLTLSILNSLLLQKYLVSIQIFRSIVGPLLYLWFLTILDVKIMLIIESILIALLVIPSFFIIKNHIFKRISLNTSPKSILNIRKRITRYFLFSSFDQFGAGIIGAKVDPFIIASIGNQYLVGIYSFSNKMFLMSGKVLPIADFMKIVNPIYYQKFTASNLDQDKFTHMSNFILKILLPIRIAPFVFFLVFGKQIINYIYDPKYIEAYWIVCLMFLSPILNCWGTPLGMVIKLFEKMEIFLISRIIGVLSIILGVLLMIYWGIVGVVIATTICSLLKWFVMYFLMRKHLPIIYHFKEMRNYFIISISIVSLFLIIQPFIINIFSLLLFSAAFLILFVLLIIIFHPFNEEDLVMLKKISDSSVLLRKSERIILKIHSIRSQFSKIKIS
jgi:O-antigen/teichoic acid export membrane protein